MVTVAEATSLPPSFFDADDDDDGTIVLVDVFGDVPVNVTIGFVGDDVLARFFFVFAVASELLLLVSFNKCSKSSLGKQYN